jgi:multiple sugar transport system substrate-binding protein
VSAAIVLVILFAGCSSSNSTSQGDPGKPLAGLKLRLVVVDDPAIANAVRGLRDEWNAQTGAEVDVVETSEKQVALAETLPGDAVICPEYLLGPLAEAKRLAPVPQALVRDPQGAWGQTFELLRSQDAVWGSEVYGVPLGSPVFCCYCRADLLEKLHRKPPQTWKEYEDVARLLHDEGTKGGGLKYGTVEPLARGWAGLVLLARAAAYAKERDNYTTLFGETTLEPAIDGPPFVRALEELVAAAKFGPAGQLDFDPAAARAEFWKGNAAMAVSWPTAAKASAEADVARPIKGNPVRAAFVELPGAAEVYRPSSHDWEPRGDDAGQHVPFLGVAGRMGVVRAESPHAGAAFQLLFWLTDPQWSSQVFAASPATTLFRRSQVLSPKAWVEGNVSAMAAKQYAERTAETLARRQFLASLRIPGRAEYLAALDEAVQAAVRGTQKPAETLKTAAEKWREINKRLGIQQQRAAYMHSLGL